MKTILSLSALLAAFVVAAPGAEAAGETFVHVADQSGGSTVAPPAACKG
jgi:hypothetical protein